MGRPSRYPPELRERAVRMVAEVLPNYPSEWPAMVAVAGKLGIGTAETVRNWVRLAQVDGGVRPGVTTEEFAEIKRLKREVAELRRANEILKAASTFFAAELERLRVASEVHQRAPDPPCRRRAALGCRADLRCADRARLQDRPVHVLRGSVPAGVEADAAR